MTQPRQKPPVPPANRSRKGTGSDPDATPGNPIAEDPEDTGETGRHANIKQNTTAGGGRQTK
jgi:hypothetical protein